MSEKQVNKSNKPRKTAAVGNKSGSGKQSGRNRGTKTNNSVGGKRTQPAKTNNRMQSKGKNKPKAPAPKVRIIPLGGLHEIGKNMTAIEYENEIIRKVRK